MCTLYRQVGGAVIYYGHDGEGWSVKWMETKRFCPCSTSLAVPVSFHFQAPTSLTLWLLVCQHGRAEIASALFQGVLKWG